mmetsp:Transcript_16129/g.27714  ORF Transcript_16129/g.27714 Transcript_16129/m.27714 type:complete len:198 (+) Transcript_16129:123-716(+)
MGDSHVSTRIFHVHHSAIKRIAAQQTGPDWIVSCSSLSQVMDAHLDADDVALNFLSAQQIGPAHDFTADVSCLSQMSSRVDTQMRHMHAQAQSMATTSEESRILDAITQRMRMKTARWSPLLYALVEARAAQERGISCKVVNEKFQSLVAETLATLGIKLDPMADIGAAVAKPVGDGPVGDVATLETIDEGLEEDSD